MVGVIQTNLANLRKAADDAAVAGELNVSAALYQKIFEARPGPVSAVNLANIQMALGLYDMVGELLEDAIRKWPSVTKLLIMYIRIDEEIGAFETTMEMLKKKLSISPRHPGLHGRASMVALSMSDELGALRHARLALKTAHPSTVTATRRFLTARAIGAGLPGLADQIAAQGHVPGTPHADVVLEKLRARLSAHFSDAETDRLAVWLQKFPAYRRQVIQMQAEFSWRADGPSPALLNIFIGLERPDDSALLSTLSLSMQLGDIDGALQILHRNPHLSCQWNRWLPVAKILSRTSDDADVHIYAGLYDNILSASQRLQARLADPLISVAVVGNSPCELGSGNGSLIDGHDEVIRFNRYSITAPYVQDYDAGLRWYLA